MPNVFIWIVFFVLFSLNQVESFIPHPLLAYGALSENSITHTDMTGLGFIRSFSHYVYEKEIQSNSNQSIDKTEFFSTEYSINDLFEYLYPKFDFIEIEIQTRPLKFVLDMMMTQNVLVDFNEKTKKLSAAHFDSEAFLNGSRRILQLKRTILDLILGSNRDIHRARLLIGRVLHTLQDFYSHSNWVEMGQTDINYNIGQNLTIGNVSRSDQNTCMESGCQRIEQTCSLWQQITLGVCPLVYYDCQNNILSEINEQKLLTSGYLLLQYNEWNETISKPLNVSKCSHGSVLDESSHLPVIGGINKDSASVIFSPHYNLHVAAANLAIKATEVFFTQLRYEIGNENFAFLFEIYPTHQQCKNASLTLRNQGKYRFLSPKLSTSTRQNLVTANLFDTIGFNEPSYDLSDQGINIRGIQDYRSSSNHKNSTEL